MKNHKYKFVQELIEDVFQNGLITIDMKDFKEESIVSEDIVKYVKEHNIKFDNEMILSNYRISKDVLPETIRTTNLDVDQKNSLVLIQLERLLPNVSLNEVESYVV